MVFNEVFGNLIIVVLIVWTVALTFLVVGAIRHYNRLTKGTVAGGLREILEALLTNQSTLKNQVGQLGKSLEEIRSDGSYHIQRIGIVRFNPFSDTGGSQSFTMAIVDGRGNGVVMTSLYARTGNRWYVKEIREGKGKDIELSKEEMSAIKKASPMNL